MASTLLAKTMLRQALVVGARGPAVAARAAGVGSTGSSRGLSWVKDVTVNVTFINHEVRIMCVYGLRETKWKEGGRRWHIRGFSQPLTQSPISSHTPGFEDNSAGPSGTKLAGCGTDARHRVRVRVWGWWGRAAEEAFGTVDGGLVWTR